MEETLGDKILRVLFEYSKEHPDTYVNPNFLSEVTSALEECCGIENAEVDKWVRDMWEW